MLFRHILFGRIIISTKGTQLLHLTTERMPFVFFTGTMTTMVIAQTTIVIAGAVATTIVKFIFMARSKTRTIITILSNISTTTHTIGITTGQALVRIVM